MSASERQASNENAKPIAASKSTPPIAVDAESLRQETSRRVESGEDRRQDRTGLP